MQSNHLIYLTTSELAHRYPVNNAPCERTFYYLLAQWRREGVLLPGRHWRFRHQTQGAGDKAREYWEGKVAQLILTRDETFCQCVAIHWGATLKDVVERARKEVVTE